MRILFLADHLGYAGGVVHGATTYFIDLLPALAAAGIQALPCFLREYHPAAEELRARGVEPIFLGANRLDPFVVNRVTSLARKHGCELLHVQGFKASVVGRMARHRLQTPLVVHVHDLKMPPRGVRLLNRALACSRDIGLCVSSASVPVAVSGYAVDPGRARVVHTGIRIADFAVNQAEARAAVRTELGIADDAPVVAMLARFHAEKGHFGMLAMMPEICRQAPRAVLVLAGDGPERPACEALGNALGLRESLRFLGSRRDVARILAASDVVVVPSLSEGLGRVPIEANLAGRPVVAFDTGGLREVIPDECAGRLVPPGDARGFVSAVLSCLPSGSPGELQALALTGADRARRAAQRFGIEAHVRRLTECYAGLLAPA
jgi:glycosyltransferase involved in cell wall biosynthesis